MTPKERADDLIKKMMKHQQFYEPFGLELAIECSLVCVDEIIAMNPSMDVPDNWGGHTENVTKYWRHVKAEIEKL